MAKFGNRVKETTDTTGTGTLDLNGAPTGFRAFGDEFTSGDEVYYLIVDDPDNPTDYEYGIGTFTSGTPDTLSRDTVEGSSNSGNKVSWTSGTKTVIATPTAAGLPVLSEANRWTRLQKWSKGSDVASANALSLGDDGNYFDITGTTAITSIGTKGAGTVVLLQFDGALTLTHHSTDLVLPGGANITTAAGDHAIFVEYAAGDWRCVDFIPATALSMLRGKHTIWIPVGSMTARTTNGPASAASELDDGNSPPANITMLSTLDFDGTTAEFAQFKIGMPKGWNLGTVTFQPYWTGAAGAGGVVWRLSGVAVSDDDTLIAAQGTAQSSTDTFIAANDLHVGPESSAITIAGTPAAGDMVNFEVSRNPADGSDTKAEDAKLIGVKVFITYNAGNDA